MPRPGDYVCDRYPAIARYPDKAEVWFWVRHIGGDGDPHPVAPGSVVWCSGELEHNGVYQPTPRTVDQNSHLRLSYDGIGGGPTDKLIGLAEREKNPKHEASCAISIDKYRPPAPPPPPPWWEERLPRLIICDVELRDEATKRARDPSWAPGPTGGQRPELAPIRVARTFSDLQALLHRRTYVNELLIVARADEDALVLVDLDLKQCRARYGDRPRPPAPVALSNGMRARDGVGVRGSARAPCWLVCCELVRTRRVGGDLPHG
jgi:hypothetical protein